MCFRGDTIDTITYRFFLCFLTGSTVVQESFSSCQVFSAALSTTAALSACAQTCVGDGARTHVDVDAVVGAIVVGAIVVGWVGGCCFCYRYRGGCHDDGVLRVRSTMVVYQYQSITSMQGFDSELDWTTA